MSKLKVHSIESFSTLDGPGIRYVLFLQGCALRCQYCHNVDTRSFEGGKLLDHLDILWELKRNLEYLKVNRGGITASGGEPLEQAEALIPLFKEVQSFSVTTCLDTAGYILNDSVKQLLDVTDIVLLDYKHTDEKEHELLVGRSNKRVQEFHRYLEKIGKTYWLRYTVLEGINDSEKDISRLQNLVNGCEHMEKIEVLPYHTLGVHKWNEMDLPYKLMNQKPYDQKKAQEIQNQLNSLK